MSFSISAIITAAGKNRRMQEDLIKRKLPLKNKLLLDIQGEPVIAHTIHRALQAGVDECVVVVGHFKDDILPVIEDMDDKRIKIVENQLDEVPLSSSLLNGVRASSGDICLCGAGDQPTVTTETFKHLIKIVIESPDPQNMLAVLARGSEGYLDSAQGLGMPLACHRKLLEEYLPQGDGNLNPLLKKMVENKVVLYGIPPINDLELINVNRYGDYLYIKQYYDLE